MNKHILFAVAITASLPVFSADSDSVTLYQVGKNGSYCLSISPNEKGCVSGMNTAGDTINILDFVKDKNVVFRNVSDAPHDMKFTGVNAESMPPQNPNGADAIKNMGTEDPNKQKITCSFHGNQLAIGYEVMGKSFGAGGGGHMDRETGSGGAAAAMRNAGAMGAMNSLASAAGRVGRIVTTGLADVSGEVLAKGRSVDVAKLVSARPELMEKLQEVRPLLAAELSASGIGRGMTITSINKSDVAPGSVLADLAGVGPAVGKLAASGGPTAFGGGKNGAAGAGTAQAAGVARGDSAKTAQVDGIGAAAKKSEANRGGAFGNYDSLVGLLADGGKAAGAPAQPKFRALASVGFDDEQGIDRTQLKAVKKAWGSLFNLHYWLILILLLAVLRIARAVTRSGHSKRR